jgi:competence protein ComEA
MVADALGRLEWYMNEDTVKRIRDLAGRAGLGEVSSATLVAALVILLVAGGIAAWRWWPENSAPAQSVDVVMGADATGRDEGSADPSGTDHSAVAQEPVHVLVHVVGAVRRPGVYSLEHGARGIDAVEAAGGLLSEAVPSRINLAKVLADGEQVVVPSEDDAEGPPPAGLGVHPTGPPVVNVNSADQAMLETLPGVGPATAIKIIAEREAKGPFWSPEDLGRVSGIGPKRLEQLKDLVSVD